MKRIAARLNEDAAPAPLPRRAGRPRGWAPSSVRDILHRELYRGVVVWNRTQKIVRRGAKGQRHRPAGEVLRVDAPALRIVSEDLWHTVHDRRVAASALYKPRGLPCSLFPRPDSTQRTCAYLLGLGPPALRVGRVQSGWAKVQ